MCAGWVFAFQWWERMLLPQRLLAFEWEGNFAEKTCAKQRTCYWPFLCQLTQAEPSPRRDSINPRKSRLRDNHCMTRCGPNLWARAALRIPPAREQQMCCWSFLGQSPRTTVPAHSGTPSQFVKKTSRRQSCHISHAHVERQANVLHAF